MIIILLFLPFMHFVAEMEGYHLAKKDERKSDRYFYLYMVLLVAFVVLYLTRPFGPAELSSEKYEWKTEYRIRKTVQIVDVSDTVHLEPKTDTVLIVKRK